MRLTREHLAFWQGRERPSWMAQIPKIVTARPTVDDCINAHAGIRTTDSAREANNYMNILRMIRARAPETLRDEMRRMAYEPWAGYSKRRNAHALKWYNRLAGGKK